MRLHVSHLAVLAPRVLRPHAFGPLQRPATGKTSRQLPHSTVVATLLLHPLRFPMIPRVCVVLWLLQAKNLFPDCILVAGVHSDAVIGAAKGSPPPPPQLCMRVIEGREAECHRWKDCPSLITMRGSRWCGHANGSTRCLSNPELAHSTLTWAAPRGCRWSSTHLITPL